MRLQIMLRSQKNTQRIHKIKNNINISYRINISYYISYYISYQPNITTSGRSWQLPRQLEAGPGCLSPAGGGAQPAGGDTGQRGHHQRPQPAPPEVLSAQPPAGLETLSQERGPGPGRLPLILSVLLTVITDVISDLASVTNEHQKSTSQLRVPDYHQCRGSASQTVRIIHQSSPEIQFPFQLKHHDKPASIVIISNATRNF